MESWSRSTHREYLCEAPLGNRIIEHLVAIDSRFLSSATHQIQVVDAFRKTLLGFIDRESLGEFAPGSFSKEWIHCIFLFDTMCSNTDTNIFIFRNCNTFVKKMLIRKATKRRNPPSYKCSCSTNYSYQKRISSWSHTRNFAMNTLVPFSFAPTQSFVKKKRISPGVQCSLIEGQKCNFDADSCLDI